ncbi:unnamed protein product [Choristocarpus tenellus]
MKVVFVHLDLGIGGAEMLVVNAAVAAVRSGHEVLIHTSHHDPHRCFQETTGNGLLAGRVVVRGGWIPRQVFGRLTALCAVIRYVAFVRVENALALALTPRSLQARNVNFLMLWLSLRLVVEGRAIGAIVCDGVSAPVPLLRLAGPV